MSSPRFDLAESPALGSPEVTTSGLVGREIGLDFNRMFSPRQDQERWLIHQLDVADELGLPVIFHERDSGGRFLEILSETHHEARRGVVHCFSGKQDELLAYLKALGIDAVTHEHAPVFTVEEAQAAKGDLPGAHTKNLFVRDKRGRMWIVVALHDRDLDLLAQRQADIVADVCRWLPGVRILVCPTYYSFDPVLEKYFGKDYVEKLNKNNGWVD